MTKLVLLLILIVLAARAFWRIMGGIIEGLSGRSPAGVPDQRVQMVRDPVCGTFVLPGHAYTIGEGRHIVCFCSAACRDAYRTRSA
jgi:hypothetical protein